ncbi:RIO1-domain-containing protein [Hysterangium stoloniferum]|nr:RIO1-domain-containing protein [Hysterangium stoloniferum]
MTYPVVEIIVNGQFDDADEDTPVAADQLAVHRTSTSTVTTSTALTEAPAFDPREGQAFVDEEILDWSEEEEADNEVLESEEYEDYWETNRLTSVDDEDWEIAERDFTKQYNRLRQHVAARSGTSDPPASSVANSIAVPTRIVPLPAVNRLRAPASAPSIPQKNSEQLVALSKYSSRLAQIDQPYGLMGISSNKKGPSERANMKDKSDRATNEQVLDPRTRLILFKMIGRGLISEVNGCVSTGKEANVYHAYTPERTHVALKIFKTSILIFKDRDRYVSGERRFRRGYSKHNPRKMVRLWAEKEMRNLKRLVTAGIPCPEPIEVRENVLVMAFLGDRDGWASRRLKDADIPEDQFSNLYKGLLLTVRKIFHQCKLVHADLSEYNILYHESQLYIIDVGQSVEQDHPSAFDFLRADLKNVEEFFGRRGVQCIGLRRAFEFVIGEGVNEDAAAAAWLETLLAETLAKGAKGINNNDEDEFHELAKEKQHADDKVFLQSYIPRTLNEVYDPERDVDLVSRGRGESLIYSDVIGVINTPIKSVPEEVSGLGADSQDNTDDDDDVEEDDQYSSGEEGRDDATIQDRRPRGHRNEDKDAKKERKKAVKEAAREKRKTKMPKAEKKRRVKTTRAGA